MPDFAPACEPLPSRALPSGVGAGSVLVPDVYADDPAAYVAFLHSSAADYEIEASAFYIHAEQFPDTASLDTATGPPTAEMVDRILGDLWETIRDAMGTAPPD